MVADLPVLWQVFERLDFVATVDRTFATPVLWRGPTAPGELLAVWLRFVISQGDHCLDHFRPWVESHRYAPSALLGKTITPTDAQDDRLADWLDRLAATDLWDALECQLNRCTVRVYRLPTEVVRIDTTTANSSADVVSESGLAVRPLQGRPVPAASQSRHRHPRPLGRASDHRRRAWGLERTGRTKRFCQYRKWCGRTGDRDGSRRVGRGCRGGHWA